MIECNYKQKNDSLLNKEVDIGLSCEVIVFSMSEDIGEEACFSRPDRSEPIVANLSISGA